MSDSVLEEENFDDDDFLEQFERELQEFECELQELEQEMNAIIEEMDREFLRMDLYDELRNQIIKTNDKIVLLRTLRHENITQQYLIDLFLSEAVSIFEGFVSSYLVMFEKYLKILEHSLNDAEKVFSRIHFKGDKTIKGLLNKKSRKTLNNPVGVHLLFSKIFKINFEIPYTTLITKKFLEDCVTIRNAHVHNDGIHNKKQITLEQVNSLIKFYIDYLNKLNSSLLQNLDENFPDASN